MNVVLLFFCVSGVLGAIRRHPSITTRDNEPVYTRSLESDARLLAQTIEPFPGALVVIANDWPLFYDVTFLRRHCVGFGRRIVNSEKSLGSAKEESILSFMSNRHDPYIVVASTDFEFSEVTASNRVDVRLDMGFDNEAAKNLHERLVELGDAASRPVSSDEVLRAMVGGNTLRRLGSYTAPLRADGDRQFQARLKELLDGAGAM
ncbi:hypothetical protein JG536_28140 (plasmid) [Burkholderia ambifaria]|uniref:hypothetical protein n=1 Tax=Burkholderia ambifaria TaxID=152480 RepID=UPI00158879AF|nr:hypothetical protein [Burkholderia ambifaria]QQJ96420.1 hypothetical protein JG536_12435 [Burkholderia ambifaria]QQK01069.1 hypothetical protein JG536_28140 [Burkholderia ambifaria]